MYYGKSWRKCRAAHLPGNDAASGQVPTTRGLPNPGRIVIVDVEKTQREGDEFKKAVEGPVSSARVPWVGSSE
jgi:hypothetical protein